MGRFLKRQCIKVAALGGMTVLILVAGCFLKGKCLADNLENFLSNPGFEDGLKNWTPREASLAGHSIDFTTQHSGKMSAKISFTKENDGYFWQSLSIPVGTKIALSGYIKTENVLGDGVYLRVYFLSRDGKY
ncbi:MAG: hypothetical protein Q7J67_00860, partial [bacterium]|nr:hypothetical protein [bacterium]